MDDADQMIQRMDQDENKLVGLRGYYSIILAEKLQPEDIAGSESLALHGKRVEIWRWLYAMRRRAYVCDELHTRLTAAGPRWQRTTSWSDGTAHTDLFIDSGGAGGTFRAAEYDEIRPFPMATAFFLLPVDHRGPSHSLWLKGHNARLVGQETIGGLECLRFDFSHEAGPQFRRDSAVWVCPDRGYRVLRYRMVQVQKAAGTDQRVGERTVTVEQFERDEENIWLPARIREDNFGLRRGVWAWYRTILYLADGVEINPDWSGGYFRPLLPAGTRVARAHPLASKVAGGDLEALIGSMLAGNFSFLPQEAQGE